MTSTIISNVPPYGLATNQLMADLTQCQEGLSRLAGAIAQAASGYDGTAGTEYETDSTLFGVVPSATPGEKGTDYRYAIDQIWAAWQTFWTAAAPNIQAIDNGVMTP